MKYAIQMGSGAMIYEHIPSFIQIGSDIQKLIAGDTQTYRQLDDFISLLLFLKYKESSLKMQLYPCKSLKSNIDIFEECSFS
jgi:hypothetical protein